MNGYTASTLHEYRPRSYGYLGLWREGDWMLKAYRIHHAAGPAGDALLTTSFVSAAREHVRARLEEANHEGSHYHAGFVVLHHGRTENWLLTLWWAHDNVCCHTVSRSSLETPTRFELVAGSVMACVWELVVIEFERRAWIDAMLRGESDRSRYLQSHLADGFY